jgi:ABC-2 type transport system permease protein
MRAPVLAAKAPGWRWLLAHELRIGWRAGGGRIVWLAILVAILWAFMHVAGWALMRHPDKILGGAMIAVAGAITWFALLLLLAAAFALAVSALFDRGDFDLLLSSPIPARTVFMVRGLGVATRSVGFLALIWLPFANAAVLHGHWRLLAGYAVLAAFALGATGIAFAATLALVRAFGVRRAKTIAQVLGAIAGALLFICMQLFNLLPVQTQKDAARWTQTDAAQAWIGAASPLWWPVRALLGETLPLLAVLAAGVGVFMLVVIRTERLFLEGTRESDAAPAKRGDARAGAFRTGLARVVIGKELLLLQRDPKLISQTLLQILYILPLFFIGVRRGGIERVVAPTVILIGATLAGNLAWMTVSGEEAPELVDSAPVSRERVLWLKVAAALIVPIAVCAPFVAFYASKSAAETAIFAFCLTGALASCAVVQVWNAKPGSGRDMKARRESKLVNLLEFSSAVGWALACFALLTGSAWAAAGLAAGLAAPALSWVLRRRRTRA